jgi:DNA-binding response OmpR family regulator
MAQILLIEPDLPLAETYAKALLAESHRVIACAGAQAAVLAADQIRPDLVILELQLVEHSGIEFLYEFRSYADWQDIPVIINSLVPPAEFAGSHTLLQDQLGVIDYLYKPRTTLKQLINVVEQSAAQPAHR